MNVRAEARTGEDYDFNGTLIAQRSAELVARVARRALMMTRLSSCGSAVFALDAFKRIVHN